MKDPKPSPRCTKILSLLPRFIENDFTVGESEEIRKHLDACPSCREEYASMARLLETLDALPALGVPATFKDAVMRHIPPSEKGKKR
ncbi:MAG: anti-sigma factor family protein [Acidobacteriota bacterium]